jgi:hypothetical protein
MAEGSRPPLTRGALAQIFALAGLSVTPAELDAVWPAAAATCAAVDSLDALDLADAEPAARFELRAENI